MLSVLRAIGSYSLIQSKDTSHLTLDIRSLLYVLSYTKTINLIWIPAHLSISYNDSVDYSAKEAFLSGVPINIKLHASEFFTSIKSKINNSHIARLKFQGKFKGNYYLSNFFFGFNKKTMVFQYSNASTTHHY